MTLQAIIFGSIGTLTETSHLQRAAFNAAFAEAGLDWHWDAEGYAAMIADGQSGGAERIAAYARSRHAQLDAAQVDRLHHRKSAIYQQRMTADGLPPRPGVVALLTETRARGIKLAMASATSPANIAAMFAATAPALTAAMFDVVLSGDDAAHGKPAPDIYLEALCRLGVAAADAVAIEDTRQSLASPQAAGIVTLVTPGAIAVHQDFGRTPVAPSLAGFGGVAAMQALLA